MLLAWRFYPSMHRWTRKQATKRKFYNSSWFYKHQLGTCSFKKYVCVCVCLQRSTHTPPNPPFGKHLCEQRMLAAVTGSAPRVLTSAAEVLFLTSDQLPQPWWAELVGTNCICSIWCVYWSGWRNNRISRHIKVQKVLFILLFPLKSEDTREKQIQIIRTLVDGPF